MTFDAIDMLMALLAGGCLYSIRSAKPEDRPVLIAIAAALVCIIVYRAIFVARS